MIKSISILVFVALIVAVAGLTVIEYAKCQSQDDSDWSANVAKFLEGAPQSDAEPVWGPNVERQKDSQFSIVLVNRSAEPNPVNSGGHVKITAVFTQGSLESSGTGADNRTLLTAAAAINSSAGAEVGTLSLQPSADDEYSGLWNASVPAGIYNVTITASSLQASDIFKDALQIEVIGTGIASGHKPGYPPGMAG
ncbi:Uncharacterised protein [uncultured archaeon]|nr:Uncharacterised protein [uncultured archaeon]